MKNKKPMGTGRDFSVLGLPRDDHMAEMPSVLSPDLLCKLLRDRQALASTQGPSAFAFVRKAEIGHVKVIHSHLGEHDMGAEEVRLLHVARDSFTYWSRGGVQFSGLFRIERDAAHLLCRLDELVGVTESHGQFLLTGRRHMDENAQRRHVLPDGESFVRRESDHVSLFQTGEVAILGLEEDFGETK